MFKHGSFLNFQFSIMNFNYENLLKPFQIGIVSFPTTLPYVPGLGSQEEKNFWFYAKTSEE
jgi:hypothetical protein